jgi:hypothetical protein
MLAITKKQAALACALPILGLIILALCFFGLNDLSIIITVSKIEWIARLKNLFLVAWLTWPTIILALALSPIYYLPVKQDKGNLYSGIGLLLIIFQFIFFIFASLDLDLAPLIGKPRPIRTSAEGTLIIEPLFRPLLCLALLFITLAMLAFTLIWLWKNRAHIEK